jgi:hypothetical protein
MPSGVSASDAHVRLSTMATWNMVPPTAPIDPNDYLIGRP